MIHEPDDCRISGRGSVLVDTAKSDIHYYYVFFLLVEPDSGCSAKSCSWTGYAHIRDSCTTNGVDSWKCRSYNLFLVAFEVHMVGSPGMAWYA